MIGLRKFCLTLSRHPMICMEIRSNQMPSFRLRPDLVAHSNASRPDEGHRSLHERLLSIDFYSSVEHGC